MRRVEGSRKLGSIRSHSRVDVQQFTERPVSTEILACSRAGQDDAIGRCQRRLQIASQRFHRQDSEERWVYPEKPRLVRLKLGATDVRGAIRKRETRLTARGRHDASNRRYLWKLRAQLCG